ncbi:MAG: PadR family transcriptional regulator [Clostridia bacterium]|nr:PadR family transcriptional regulator [Clostridia bacterium]
MIFNVNGALLDTLVLSIVERADTYGYEITRELRESLEISESTLYPVLRRLQKDACLEIYDKEFSGRNRRYYSITDRGKCQLKMYRNEWKNYRDKINNIVEEGDNCE